MADRAQLQAKLGTADLIRLLDGCHEDTVYRLIHREVDPLPAYKITGRGRRGGRWLCDPEDFRAWLARQAEKPASATKR